MTLVKQHVDVHGRRMAYVDEGEGPAVVFLHGNPTSSYLWRDVMPHLRDHRRIAPDLIGMGDSDKLPDAGPGTYRFVEHRRYLDGLLDAVLPDGPVVLVVHDWGSGLGFDWARRNPDRVRGLCFMEAICGPVSFEDWPDSAQKIFAGMRSDAGEEICLTKNVFVERILPSSVMRDLSDEEMAEYRRPFAEPGEDRRPTLTWPREIPFDGEPADVHEIVTAYRDWLRTPDSPPKLWIRAEPGFLTGVYEDEVSAWPDVDTVTVAGIHFIQEDSPGEIGRALANWLRTLD